MVYASGYRIGEVNSQRRKGPQRGGFGQFWPSSHVNGSGPNREKSRGYSHGSRGAEIKRGGQRWRRERCCRRTFSGFSSTTYVNSSYEGQKAGRSGVG